jgi:plasmid stabilization system protein ParE
MEVVWSKSSEKELKRAFDFISLDSEINAKKIAETFVKMTLDLANHPTKHPLDKYKINNQGNWRAFEKFNFRLSYRVTSTQIRIVRLRHTSRNPKIY